MAKKHIDSLKAKQKKQKMIAAVLGVLFLGVMGFEGPKTWKKLHPPAAPAAVNWDERPAGATTTTPSLAAPSLSGNPTPTTDTTSDGSLASSTPPPVADGQLSSFSRFASKDPFAQQLNENDGSSSGGASTPASGGSAGSGDGGTSSPSDSGNSGGSGGSASAPRPGTAVISLNGTLYTVAVGSDFPAASETDPSIVPVFHLVSATAHSVKISIVGGSYASGSSTVTLQENKPVTLMNTADGTRYKLILKPVGTAVPAAAAPTSPTSTTVTVPPPASP
jgi:hypothetical protein